jgi:hypothetical protein
MSKKDEPCIFVAREAPFYEMVLVMYYSLFIIILSGVRLSLVGSVATIGLLYQPQMIEDGDCGAIGGMTIGRGN